jgi:hypothetical protein
VPAAIQQSHAADGVIACFSSNLVPCNLNADRAPQLKAVVGWLRGCPQREKVARPLGCIQSQYYFGVMKRAAFLFAVGSFTFVLGIFAVSIRSALFNSPEEDNIGAVMIPAAVKHPSLDMCDYFTQRDSQIRKVDFGNFRFPGFYDKRIHLQNGIQEITRECGGTIYTLQDVLYVDFTGDGREEALVSVEDFSGCGSSGVSYNYYVYTIKSGHPFLLWRLATGSQGLAGLKDFKLEGEELIFDVFGDSRIVGNEIVGGGAGGECCPEHFSRIRVAWNGETFRQFSVRVFPL